MIFEITYYLNDIKIGNFHGTQKCLDEMVNVFNMMQNRYTSTITEMEKIFQRKVTEKAYCIVVIFKSNGDILDIKEFIYKESDYRDQVTEYLTRNCETHHIREVREPDDL